MAHLISFEDRAFRDDLETGRIAPDEFNHRAHVRLAYIYLAENDTERATELMRDALKSFLAHHGIAPGKYHETLTRSWLLAVRHFMNGSAGAASADSFIEQNPRLLDPKIMLTHYSAEVLFGPEARAAFMEPDVEAIPWQPRQSGSSTPTNT